MSDSLDYREAADYVAESGDTATAANALRSAADQIERLAEALEEACAWIELSIPRDLRLAADTKLVVRLRAVLADKEDAGDE